MNAALSSMEIEPPAEHHSGDLRARYEVGLLDRLLELVLGTARLRDLPAH